MQRRQPLSSSKVGQKLVGPLRKISPALAPSPSGTWAFRGDSTDDVDLVTLALSPHPPDPLASKWSITPARIPFNPEFGDMDATGGSNIKRVRMALGHF